MPDVAPFADFCKRVSRDARPMPRTPTVKDNTVYMIRDSVSPILTDSEASELIMLASEGATELKLPPVVRPRSRNAHPISYGEPEQDSRS